MNRGAHMLKLATLCAFAALALSSAAQEWKPSKNIEFIVNSGAGGAGDRGARVPQCLLQSLLGLPSITVVKSAGIKGE